MGLIDFIMNLLDKNKLEVVGEITSTDVIHLFLEHWSQEELFPPGITKLKIASGRYKLCTFESMEKFIKSKKCGSKYLPFEDDFHSCPKYAADFLGQFCHNKKNPGAAVGTVTILQGIKYHRLGFMIGTVTQTTDPMLRYWEVMDETYRGVGTVAGKPLDMVWMP